MSNYDNLEQVYLSNKSIEKKNSKKHQAALTVGLLAFTLFTTGCGNGEAEAAKQPEVTPPVAESSEIVKTTELEEKTIEMKKLGTEAEMSIPTKFSNGELVNYSVAPTNLIESYNFEFLSAEEQTKLKDYEAMELSEFRDLSNEEQLVFASWVLENNQPRFEKMLAAYGIDKQYSYYVNKDSEIIENYEYINIFIASLYVQDPESKDGGLKYDAETAYKLESLLQTPVVYKDQGLSLQRSYDKKIVFFKDYKTLNISDYTVNILKTGNMEIRGLGHIYGGIIANLELIGSKSVIYNTKEYQALFQITPTITVDGRKIEITQLGSLDTMDDAVDFGN